MNGNDDSTSGSKRVAKFTKDVLHAGIVDAVSKAVFYVGLAVVAAFALLVWRGGSVPAWCAALAVLLVIIAGLVLRSRLAGQVVRLGDTVTSLQGEGTVLQARVDELEPLEAEVAKLRDDNERFQWGLDRHEAYGAHVSQVLGHLHRVLSGDIPGVSIPAFIERGILAPARDLLASSAAEDVRLSVLLPEGDNFYMAWAAGHSIESQQKYEVRIATSLRLSRGRRSSAQLPMQRSLLPADRHRDQLPVRRRSRRVGGCLPGVAAGGVNTQSHGRRWGGDDPRTSAEQALPFRAAGQGRCLGSDRVVRRLGLHAADVLDVPGSVNPAQPLDVEIGLVDLPVAQRVLGQVDPAQRAVVHVEAAQRTVADVATLHRSVRDVAPQ
jgi:hypothetical protein